MSGTRKTLVPEAIGSEGEEFLFKGPTKTCQSCNWRAACVEGLEPGRVYRVLTVDKRKRFSCRLGSEMVLATIEEAHLVVALPSKKAVVGATVYYRRPSNCDNVSCKYFRYCRPDGVYEGDRIKIIREVGKIEEDCNLGDVRLYEVELR